MAVFVNFGAIVVNNMTNNAGIFFGENVQQGWFSPAKTNYSLNIFGNGNLTLSNININSDPDLIDTPSCFTNVNTPTAPVILKGT